MALPATQPQMRLDLGVEVERDIDGIEMGVLENGMAYLTQRGLAGITGAARSTIQEISKEWEDNYSSGFEPRGRAQYFANYMREANYDSPTLFMEVEMNGTAHYAYPEIVCMAFIEFFAFEAQRTNPTAMTNFRKLARYGLNNFIYDALGYRPTDKWKYFNDRVSLVQDASPDGHFILFKETTGMIVDLIRGGLPVSDKTIPDISVGSHWGRYWTDNGLEARFGGRIKFEHNYPSYYPQSMSNPQTPWAYPDEALAEFRRWFRTVYLPTKYPPYILSKAKTLSGGNAQAEALANLYVPGKLEDRR